MLPFKRVDNRPSSCKFVTSSGKENTRDHPSMCRALVDSRPDCFPLFPRFPRSPLFWRLEQSVTSATNVSLGSGLLLGCSSQGEARVSSDLVGSVSALKPASSTESSIPGERSREKRRQQQSTQHLGPPTLGYSSYYTMRVVDGHCRFGSRERLDWLRGLRLY